MGKADANADGIITVEELKAGAEKMRAEHLAKVDTDHDGKVSPEERKAAFEKFAHERFAKMDKNNDGALSKDEVGDKRWQHLSVADADKNGSITRDEIKTAVAAGTLKFPHHGRRGHGHGPHGEGAAAPEGDAAPPASDVPSGT
jgi:Ca2+-binding EF-hand superfamily protein